MPQNLLMRGESLPGMPSRALGCLFTGKWVISLAAWLPFTVLALEAQASRRGGGVGSPSLGLGCPPLLPPPGLFWGCPIESSSTGGCELQFGWLTLWWKVQLTRQKRAAPGHLSRAIGCCPSLDLPDFSTLPTASPSLAPPPAGRGHGPKVGGQAASSDGKPGSVGTGLALSGCLPFLKGCVYV